jgi:hypothetical protein
MNRNASVSRRRSHSTINVGDKVVIKNQSLRPKKGEVFEVVGIETISILNSAGRTKAIHVSNLKRVPS